MQNKNGAGEPGIDSHVILWHDNITAVITKVVMQLCKAPTNSTFTDSSIPIHALTTIRLFAKQSMLLNSFPGSSGTADRSCR